MTIPNVTKKKEKSFKTDSPSVNRSSDLGLQTWDFRLGDSDLGLQTLSIRLLQNGLNFEDL